MSANFHAFQNREFLFEGYEVIAAEWRSRFTDFNPKRIAGILGLSYDEKHLFVTYYGRNYRLRLEDGVLEKQVEASAKELPSEEAARNQVSHAAIGRVFGGKSEPSARGWTDRLWFNEAMAIYHVLSFTKDSPVLSGKFIPAIQAEKGRANAPDPLLDRFAAIFSGRTGELKEAARLIGAELLDQGDVSLDAEAMAGIRLKLVFWDADEDFPAQVQIFVDERITDYVHPETIGCLISDLFEKLEQAADA